MWRADPELKRFLTPREDPAPPPLPPNEVEAISSSSTPSSTPSQPLQPQVNLVDRPVPENKVQELQTVINAIDHYAIDLEDLARQQALDPEFRALMRNAQTGLSFRKLKVHIYLNTKQSLKQ